MDNRKQMEFKKYINGRKVAVLGVGISNRPLIEYIHSLGAQITAFDILEQSDPVLQKTISDFESKGIHVQWVCGKHYLSQLPNHGFELIFRTPKLRADLPEIRKAVLEGSVLTSEMEVFISLCPARIIAVTGSDGKTTTTTLISLFLKAAGHHVHVGGNIGTPLLNQIDRIEPSDFVVLELSSFQLMTMKNPIDDAVVTNISPNHLDFHKDYEEYIRSKMNIFLTQPFWGRLVINADNEITQNLTSDAKGKVSFFSWDRKSLLTKQNPSSFSESAFVKDKMIWVSSNNIHTRIVCVDDILVPGKHNIENYMAAVMAVFPYVRPQHIESVARSFSGVEHRIELITTIDGVRYFNSSIDTSPNRTIHTMNALAERGEIGVLITGGRDKECDYTGLGEAILNVCDRIILCGENRDKIRNAIESESSNKTYRIIECTSYDQAVKKANELSKSGEIVILSPAGTSYDQFRHFEERGNLFKQLVAQLLR